MDKSLTLKQQAILIEELVSALEEQRLINTQQNLVNQKMLEMQIESRDLVDSLQAILVKLTKSLGFNLDLE